MTLTLQLSPEMEAKLRERAAREGKPVDAFTVQAIGEYLAIPATPKIDPNSLPYDEWLKLWRAWVDRDWPQVAHLDDSRESIYREREECQL
jgi:hypothetical protein